MHVLLLKEPRDAQDPYRSALKAHQVDFLPVLDHKLTDSNRLQSVLAEEVYTGVIITSQRAVEAWGEASKAVVRLETRCNWSSIAFYVVGPATKHRLLELQSSHVPPAQLILGAEESGTGESLAEFIANRLASGNESSKLLYLIGDKRRDTLTRILSSAQIPVFELQVYETFPATGVEKGFEAWWQSCATLPKNQRWVVFFSPSGARLVIPPLLQSGRIEQLQLACIGPTTRDFLMSEYGIEANAVCENPEASSLVKALGLA